MHMYGRLVITVAAASILAACIPPASNPPASSPSPSIAPTAVATGASPVPATGAPSEPAEPSEEPSETGNDDCGRVVSNSNPSGSASKPLAVFASPDGISLYDIKANAVTVLNPTDSQPGRVPRFRTPSFVSYIHSREPADDSHTFGQHSLYGVDLDSGQVQEMIRLRSHLLAFDWSPDGTELAYLVESADQNENHLCLFETHSGATRSIRSFSYTVGRGGHQWDEVSVAWSPMATGILVVHTTTEQPSIHVVGVDGRDVSPPQMGTFARWLGNEAVLYLEGHPQSPLSGWHWFSLSTRTGQKRAYGMPDEAFRPALSPDGDFIAFDDGAKEPSIYVFDVETATSRRLAPGVAPVWLRPKLIAATAAGPCPRSYYCVIPWLESDRAVGIDPATGDRKQLSLTTTLQAPALYGVIDVLHASAP
jgi:hypothetical protein